VLLDCALQESGLDAGVVDPLADLPDEELGDRLDTAVAEEVRQLEKRVDTGCDDDVEVDLGVDPLDAWDIATEAERRRVDERLDPGCSDGPQRLDRVGDANLLVPVARPPDVAVVLQRLLLEDEDVLVHQRPPEAARLDRPTNGLDAQMLSAISFAVCSRSRYAEWRSSGRSFSSWAVPW
jgi:hypothetical protein